MVPRQRHNVIILSDVSIPVTKMVTKTAAIEAPSIILFWNRKKENFSAFHLTLHENIQQASQVFVTRFVSCSGNLQLKSNVTSFLNVFPFPSKYKVKKKSTKFSLY
jgi:hypothetical protein